VYTKKRKRKKEKNQNKKKRKYKKKIEREGVIACFVGFLLKSFFYFSLNLSTLPQTILAYPKPYL
jgi:hypothetical protein